MNIPPPLNLSQICPQFRSGLFVCNKWLTTTCSTLPLQAPALPPPTPRHPPPPSPLQPHVIGSGNLIYVSLEIEILTFALYSGDFTASTGLEDGRDGRILWALSNSLVGII